MIVYPLTDGEARAVTLVVRVLGTASIVVLCGLIALEVMV